MGRSVTILEVAGDFGFHSQKASSCVCMNCSSSPKGLLFYRYLGVLGSYPQLGMCLTLTLSSHMRRGINMRVGTVLVTAPMVPARGTTTNSALVCFSC
jgi:hypothetical protein